MKMFRMDEMAHRLIEDAKERMQDIGWEHPTNSDAIRYMHEKAFNDKHTQHKPK